MWTNLLSTSCDSQLVHYHWYLWCITHTLTYTNIKYCIQGESYILWMATWKGFRNSFLRFLCIFLMADKKLRMKILRTVRSLWNPIWPLKIITYTSYCYVICICVVNNEWVVSCYCESVAMTVACWVLL